MTVEQAVEVLAVFGSEQDPVFYKGLETTPSAMMDMRGQPNKIYISYWKIGGKEIKGTLSGMVKDRMKSLAF